MFIKKEEDQGEDWTSLWEAALLDDGEQEDEQEIFLKKKRIKKEEDAVSVKQEIKEENVWDSLGEEEEEDVDVKQEIIWETAWKGEIKAGEAFWGDVDLVCGRGG